MIEELRFIFIVIIMNAEFLTVWLSLRKDSTYAENRLLVHAFLMVGIYDISMVFYDGIATIEVVEISV